MGVRVKTFGNVQTAGVMPEVVDSSLDQREVTVDGMSYHFGPNEVKNFLDEGVGAKAAVFRSGGSADGIVEDAVPFGDSRS